MTEKSENKKLNDSPHTPRTIHTVCKIGACEPFCGLTVKVEGGKISSVQPNKDHPLSQGYICTKGMNILDYQNSPDRLQHPLKHVGEDWKRIPWSQTTQEIGSRLREIADKHGPRSIATYWGNAADSLGIVVANTFCHAFGSPNSYNVLSLEYTDRGVVAEELYGNENIILQPDVTKAKYAILLGTNPLVTQGLTLLQRRPHIGRDLRKAKAAGGKIVVVDPRETETARLADHHLAIRPGTDLFFLLALIHTIIVEELYDKNYIENHVAGFDDWKAFIPLFSLDRAENITGIEAPLIRKIAREFAAAEGAYVSTRVGVQTSHNSTLTEWAVATLCVITGNIDRPGGLYYNFGVVDTPALIKKFTKRKNTSPSRIGAYPPIFGGLPAAVLPDEILTEGEGQVKALVVIAGNPVISFPNTKKTEEALRKLDLLVVVDIFLNDTATFADYVLPASTGFERESWHFLVDAFNPYPFAELRPKVVEPPGECRGEWEMFKDISRVAGVPFLNNPLFDKLGRVLDFTGIGFTPSFLHRYLLRGKKPSYRALKKNSQGMKGNPLNFGEFFAKQIHTKDRRIHLAPAKFVEELKRAIGAPPTVSQKYPFMLISGARRLASYNSWTHNMPNLAEQLKGNWATLNDQDAKRLKIEEGDLVSIQSAVGEVEIEARMSSKIARGVVAIHQHWGHVYESGMTTAQKYPGVNVNNLHPDTARDTFCGMPIYNGTPVNVNSVSK